MKDLTLVSGRGSVYCMLKKQRDAPSARSHDARVDERGVVQLDWHETALEGSPRTKYTQRR